MSFKNWFSRGADSSNFEQLISPHIDYLYRLAYRFTNNRLDAEDLVQDLLVKLYGRREEVAGIEKLRPWLAQVLYRMFLDQVRQNQRRPISDDADIDIGEFEHPDRGPAQLLEQAITQERLQVAYGRLNQDQRALLALHDIEGYTLLELETILETPVGTLKSRLHRARKRLREYL